MWGAPVSRRGAPARRVQPSRRETRLRLPPARGRRRRVRVRGRRRRARGAVTVLGGASVGDRLRAAGDVREPGVLGTGRLGCALFHDTRQRRAGHGFDDPCAQSGGRLVRWRHRGEPPRDRQQRQHLVHGIAVHLEMGVERRPVARVQRAERVEAGQITGRRRVGRRLGRALARGDMARKTAQPRPDACIGRIRGLFEPARDLGDGQAVEVRELDGESFQRRQRAERRAQARRFLGEDAVGDPCVGRVGQVQGRDIARPGLRSRATRSGRVRPRGVRRRPLVRPIARANMIDGAYARHRQQPVGAGRLPARMASGFRPGRCEDPAHGRFRVGRLTRDPHRQRVDLVGVPVVERGKRAGVVRYQTHLRIAVARRWRCGSPARWRVHHGST